MTLKTFLIRSIATALVGTLLCLPNLTPACGAHALQEPGTTAMLTTTERNAVIGGVLKRVRELYVFPEAATKMQQAIQDRTREGEYDRITDSRELAKKLTDDLQAVSHDGHLRVLFRLKTPTIDAAAAPDRQNQEEAIQAEGKRTNWGFVRAEILPGNIGYLDLRGFIPRHTRAIKLPPRWRFSRIPMR